jgi:hypothetical protein
MKLGANVTGVGVEDKGDIASVLWGMANVDADSGSRLPSWLLGRGTLKVGVQDKDWTAKGAKMS